MEFSIFDFRFSLWEWVLNRRAFPRSRLFALCMAGLPWIACAQSSEIPKRPEELKFPPLVYTPPKAADYRVALKSGPVAYVVPDKSLPLVNIVIYVRTGKYLEPAGKEALAELTGHLLTHGGTKNLAAESFEERVAFLAADLDSSIADTQGSVSLNLLSKDLDEGLKLLREVLTEPRFQDDKIALYRQQKLQEMQQRNDDSEAIEAREAAFLAYGAKFWINDHATSNSVVSISRDDLAAFHRKWFVPENFVVAANGDFDRDAMAGKLEALFANWPFPGEKPPPIPTDTSFAPPGVYIVNKDVNQGRVSMMLPGIRRDNPDYFKVLVMNDILGGGDFSSRITKSVRSDEGLAYSAYSIFPGGVYYPLVFTAAFQSKSRTVTYAASIVLKQMKSMIDGEPTDEEMSISKRGFIDRLPQTFSTRAKVANVLAQDEFTGRYARDPDFWQKYPARIEAVTKADVERVAKKFITPEKTVILIVGQKSDISMKLPEHPVTLQELTTGRVVDVPMRDPMTMLPMPLP
jgi:zinc protease